MSRDPTRLADLRAALSPEAEFMGGIIRAQRGAHPPEGKMQELGARLEPLLASKGSSPPRTMPWFGLSVVAAALVIGAAWSTGSNDYGRPLAENVPARPRDPTAASPTAADVPATPAISVDALPNVGASDHATTRASAVPTSASAASAPAVSAWPAACDEVELVDRADTKLRSGDPAAALAIAREHEQRCKSPVLVQERERIAIEALAKLGRASATRARARAFEERFPSSPHLRRVRQVLDGLPR